MVKMWVKTISDEKLTRSIIYENDSTYSSKDFFKYISEVCAILDIPTPVILKSHESSFAEFNICKFTKRDFVESTDFDKLVIESAI